MKIAEIVCTFPPCHGGMGNVCFHNALELARLGHDVTVFTLDHGRKDINDPAEFKVERFKTPLIYGDGGIAPQLLCKLKGFDVFHLHYPFFGGAEHVCLASKRGNQKLCITYHMDVEGTNWLKRIIINTYEALLLKWIVNSAHMISAPSKKFLETTKAGLFVPWKRYTKTGHGGVDVDRFKPMERDSGLEKKYNIKDKTVILFVGNLIAFKGLHILINAISEIKNDDIVLLVIGGGYEEPKYRKQAVDLGLEHRVIFAGPQSHDGDLPSFYNLGDFLALPSTHSESFGLVALEAMASEKPVIISDLPGPAGIVQDNIDGFIVPVNDSKSLQEKISLLAEDNAVRNKMGKAARKKIIAQYSWKTIALELEKGFYDLLRVSCEN
jgi:glycosyltransferase involved in cell wall biosynthesis